MSTGLVDVIEEIHVVETGEVMVEIVEVGIQGLQGIPGTGGVGGGGSGTYNALSISSTGQTLLNVPGPITNPASTNLIVNHATYQYGIDYLLNTTTLVLTWQGPFNLEPTDQIGLVI
jgi:hypothetical protein